MQLTNYIYLYRYQPVEKELCELEANCLFDQAVVDKLLFSDRRVEPERSAFIKKRLEVSLFSEDYADLIQQIKQANIQAEGFKVEYVVFEGDATEYPTRLTKLKDIGYRIEGTPDYREPSITYALWKYQELWCFGTLVKNSNSWYDHKQKPHSYSNSININTAKALVNIASKGNKESKLLDACCGVGTIMLEACYSGYDIDGCDINWKICKDARGNLAHFDYPAPVYRSDVKDIDCLYDAAIVDLPYNLLSHASDEDVLHIIGSAGKIAPRLVIVSIADIGTLIDRIDFKVAEKCSVGKRGKTNFARQVWVCEKRD